MKKLLIILSLFLISGCEIISPTPKPLALFDIDYRNNGLIILENLSSNADNYFWDFGDGFSSGDFTPIHKYTRNGDYTISLKAYGKGGESSFTRTAKIDNIPVAGSNIFWSTLNMRIKIYINGTYVGMTTKYRANATAPECGIEGFVTVTLPEGTYNYTAEEDTYLFPTRWAGQIDIYNGVCRSMRLTN